MDSSIQVWSAGLETWEDCVLSLQDRVQLTHVHDKTVGYKVYAFFTDPLNRWYRAPLDTPRSDP